MVSNSESLMQAIEKIERLRLDEPEQAADEISRIIWGEPGRTLFADHRGFPYLPCVYVEDMLDLIFELRRTDGGWQPVKVDRLERY